MELTRPTSARNHQVPLFVPNFEPAPYKRDEYLREILEVLRIMQEWNWSLPLVNWMNRQDVITAGKLTAIEVGEAVEEWKKNHPEKAVEEWIDTITIPASLLLHPVRVDIKNDVLPHVNGQGRNSKVYKQAVEVAGNFSPTPDKLEKDIQRFLVLMFSSLIHAPRFESELIPLAKAKRKTNEGNYPKEVFEVRDEHGKPLSSDERRAKYDHVMKCLKWLRSLQPNRVLPADWRLVKDYILAFRSSDEAFKMLQTRWLELHSETLTVLVP